MGVSPLSGFRNGWFVVGEGLKVQMRQMCLNMIKHLKRKYRQACKDNEHVFKTYYLVEHFNTSK